MFIAEKIAFNLLWNFYGIFIYVFRGFKKFPETFIALTCSLLSEMRKMYNCTKSEFTKSIFLKRT